MSFLQPLFLLAATAVAVPVLLHLYHRHESRRVVFPAVRYLLRTEREHATRIRLRQLLLLLVRAAVVLLLVAAGARLTVHGRGGAHEPTALAVILDNSLSSSRVVGEERILDVLEARARETLDAAGPEDRIWILRAGEPWQTSPPGDVRATLARLDSTAPSGASSDLGASLARARALVESAGLPAAEIHLLSDLQRTAFPADRAGTAAGDVPVVVWAPSLPGPANHWIDTVMVGGGLPPLAGRRTEIAVHLGATASTDSGSRRLPVRVAVGDRVRAAAEGRPGEEVILPLGPFQAGSVVGWAETDPDALRADDRRWFVLRVRPPLRVHRHGAPSLFLDEALEVLVEAGRVVPASTGPVSALLSTGGAGLPGRGSAPVIVFPPSDPALLPALNRRLSDGGVPWRYGPPVGEGEARVAESRIPVDLEGLGVSRHFLLSPTGDAPPAADVPARLSTGEPFAVAGSSASGPYLLFAVPPHPSWSELPLSPAMVPLLEWALTRWASPGDRPHGLEAGQPLSTPPGATAVRDPAGVVHPLDGSRVFAGTGSTGVWEVLAGDSVLERVAVNPPVRESRLERVEPGELTRMVGGATVAVDDPAGWRREIFRSRRGLEPWRPLLVAALALLLLESWIAASGSSRPPARERRPPPDRGTPRRRRGAPDRSGGGPADDARPTPVPER